MRDIIKMYFGEVRLKSVDWIYMAVDRDWWRALVYFSVTKANGLVEIRIQLLRVQVQIVTTAPNSSL
jgi:hypothetical protein